MSKFSHTNFKVIIDGKDITESVITAEVFMDITNPCWSARVSLLDSINLIDKLPIKKNSKVKIIFETSNFILSRCKREFNFVLYKISDKVHFNQNSIGYTLYLAVSPLIINLTTRFSRHLTGEPTMLICDLFNEVFPEYTCTTTGSNGQVNMIASSWTPFNTFGQLLKASHKDNNADFLLVQTSDKTFNVKSIYEMYSDNSGIKFKYMPAAIGTAITYPHLITKYEVEHFDGALNLVSGYYANNVTTYDYTTKKWQVTDYNNDKDKSKLSDGNSYTNDSKSHTTFQPMHHNITDDSSQLNDFNTWLPSRRSSIFKLEQEKLLIQTSANMEYSDLLGKSVLVEMPKQDYNSLLKLDRKRSGKYLVSAISFVFNKQMFVSNLELIKREFEGIYL